MLEQRSDLMGKLSLRRKLATGLGALSLILLAIAIAAYRAVDQLGTLSNQSRRSRLEGRNGTNSSDAAMMKESSGSRGFLLLNQEATLQRVEDGKRQ
jgi:CHASE3 domain sensor protein